MMYTCTVEHLAGEFSKQLDVTPKVWRCPCGSRDCFSAVLYARGPEDGRIYFMSTVTTKAEPPYSAISIDNVEDLDTFLRTRTLLPAADLRMYAQWFTMGLKEALLSLLACSPA